jgi:hypothetical protein
MTESTRPGAGPPIARSTAAGGAAPNVIHVSPIGPRGGGGATGLLGPWSADAGRVTHHQSPRGLRRRRPDDRP